MSVMDTDADTDRGTCEAVDLPMELPTDYPAWLRLRPRITQELLQLAELESCPERVVQLNFQMFPLSKVARPNPSKPGPGRKPRSKSTRKEKS